MVSYFPAILRRAAAPGSHTFRMMPYSLIYTSRSFASSTAPTSERLDLAKEQEPFSAPLEELDDLRNRIFRLRFPKRSATAVLEKWVSEGREATAPELRNIGWDLRRSQRFKHALEISEWMKGHPEYELSDSDYAMRIDLIAKVFGVCSAEEFFRGLPPAAKSYEVYTALLHCYAGAKLIEQAESFFESIKDSSFSISILPFNEMMTLYTSVGQLGKVQVIIEEIKRRKIMPDLFTYNLWISACAATLDIEGARKILEEMASTNSTSDCTWEIYAKLVNIYISAGQLVSSDNSLIDSDKKSVRREWITYDLLIILHASLGNIYKINEIWKALHQTSQKMSNRNYMCVLSSYLVTGKLKEAGDIIDEWTQSKFLDFDITACNRLLDGFKTVGLKETAETLLGLMRLKNYEMEGIAQALD